MDVESLVEGAVAVITLNVNELDDPDFVGMVTAILNSLVRSYQPDDVYVVEVLHWFDWKWQMFSGKVHGAFGTWNKELVIPPFTPKRILSESHFRLTDRTTNAYSIASAKPLHPYHFGKHAPLIEKITQSGVFLWRSGDTRNSDKASLLSYQVRDRDKSSWYASFSKNGIWKISSVDGIARQILQDMIDH